MRARSARCTNCNVQINVDLMKTLKAVTTVVTLDFGKA